jgi:hypothetical protein
MCTRCFLATYLCFVLFFFKKIQFPATKERSVLRVWQCQSDALSPMIAKASVFERNLLQCGYALGSALGGMLALREDPTDLDAIRGGSIAEHTQATM